MEARVMYRRYKTAIVFNAFLMAGMLGANPIAQAFGWVPVTELVKNLRARSSRRVRKVFQND